MAGAFADAFGLGEGEESIATVDADGVALAAIQGLAAKLDEQADRIDDLEAENEQLCDRLTVMADQLTGLETDERSPASADD